MNENIPNLKCNLERKYVVHLRIVQQMVRNAGSFCLFKKKQLMATQQVICVRNAVKEGNGEIQSETKESPTNYPTCVL